MVIALFSKKHTLTSYVLSEQDLQPAQSHQEHKQYMARNMSQLNFKACESHMFLSFGISLLYNKETTFLPLCDVKEKTNCKTKSGNSYYFKMSDDGSEYSNELEEEVTDLSNRYVVFS